MLSKIKAMLFGERDAHQEPQNITQASSDEKRTEAAHPDIAHHADPEIQIIAGRYGELVDGKVIETNLTELEEILPRPRRRADAYATVAKRLATMGITLVIKREVRHGE